ncbi:MAG: hypothetical protein WCC69_13815 [Pirellulales bacterium]
MVALLTALAILFASFAHSPVQTPGTSITKATDCDSDSGVAEHASRDAEEDAPEEYDLKAAGAWGWAATTPLLPPASCRLGSLQAHTAWPAAGRQHGPGVVRGPPA